MHLLEIIAEYVSQAALPVVPIGLLTAAGQHPIEVICAVALLLIAAVVSRR